MGLGDLYGAALTLVLFGVIIGAGILVLVNFQSALDADAANTCATNASACTAAQNTINSTQNAVSSLATTWLPVIVVIVAAAIILGLVLRSFGGKR